MAKYDHGMEYAEYRFQQGSQNWKKNWAKNPAIQYDFEGAEALKQLVLSGKTLGCSEDEDSRTFIYPPVYPDPEPEPSTELLDEVRDDFFRRLKIAIISHGR